MRQLILALSAFILCLNLNAQGYTNPIVKGFNPDPSVCRVGDDYYMEFDAVCQLFRKCDSQWSG